MRYFLLLTGLVFTGQYLGAQGVFLNDCPPNLTVCMGNNCNSTAATFNMLGNTNCFDPNLTYECRIDFNNNGGFDQIVNNSTVTANFPPGISRLTWKATSNCGTSATCSQLVSVQDCTAPNLLCINGVTLSLDQNCTAMVEAENFVNTLTDNCTPTNQLQFGLRRIGAGTGFPAFDTIQYKQCDQGTNLVQVWVRDAAGNMNSCSNYVLVQNNSSNCPCIQESNMNITGCARTWTNTDMQSFRLRAVVERLDAAGQPTAVLANKVQNSQDSCFSVLIEDLPVNINTRTTVRAQRFDQAIEGLSTYDLVLISRHLLLLEPFTSQYQVLAADITNSKTLTTFDVVEGRKVILGVYDTFPDLPTWRFIRPLSNPNNTSVGFPVIVDTFQVQHTGLAGNVNLGPFTFVGVKTGDIDRTANLTGGADERFGTPLSLYCTDQWIPAGTTLQVPVYPTESLDLSGWQLAIGTDSESLELLGLTGLSNQSYHFRPEESMARIAWINPAFGTPQYFDRDTPLFTLQLRAKQAVQLSQALSLRTDKMAAEATDASVTRRDIYLHFLNDPASVNQATQVFAPVPNPVTDLTRWTVQLGQSNTVLLQLYDLNGRLVHLQRQYADAGYAQVELTADALPAAGLYFWQMWVGDEVFQGKLLRH
jgi:hypothetical protein